jgi:hypothetical protein
MNGFLYVSMCHRLFKPIRATKKLSYSGGSIKATVTANVVIAGTLEGPAFCSSVLKQCLNGPVSTPKMLVELSDATHRLNELHEALRKV